MEEKGKAHNSDELLVDMDKVKKFANDITQPVTDAATHPDGYLDAALLLCGLGYFLDKTIDVLCKDEIAKRKSIVDWFCGLLKKDYDDVDKDI